MPPTFATTGTVWKSEAKACARMCCCAKADVVIAAASVRTMSEMRLMLLSPIRLMIRSRLLLIGIGDGRRYDRIRSAVTLEQSLMGRSKEREARQEVFVVRLNAFCQTRSGIAGGDEADEHRVYVHLMFIRCCPAAEAPAIGKLRVDCGIKRNYIACRAVSDRDRTPEVDCIDDVEPGAFECGYCR